MNSSFESVDASLFFSRHDALDPRLGDCVQRQIEGAQVVLLGYPDDDGIIINGGRLGAALGPREIRHWLYRMTPHLKFSARRFYDGGNLRHEGELGQRHEAARGAVTKVLQMGARALTLGGGNDYAYADGLAFLEAQKDSKVRPLVINVDAHLDVRSTDRGYHSGTPFFRLLESGLPFDFVEFGIQPQANARAHLDYVTSKSGRVISVEEPLISGRSWLQIAESLLPSHGQIRPCYLAIDIDAFALPFAAGASSSWPLGLLPHEFYPILLTWLKHLDVRVMGIYETSPPLDVSASAAKWAAQLAHTYLHDV